MLRHAITINHPSSAPAMTPPTPPPPAPPEYRILALYRFAPLVPPAASSSGDGASDAPPGGIPPLDPARHPALRALQSELRAELRRRDARGTLLLAPEGINGTICYPWTRGGGEDGDGDGDDPVAAYLKAHPLFGGPELRTRMSVWRDEGDDVDVGDGLKLRKRPQQAFHRLKIKIKAEIVTLGLGRPLIDRTPVSALPHDEESTPNPSTAVESLDRHASNQLANPLATTGRYLSPAQWDEACRDPDILVIDTRNTYEIEIGTFEGAVDPGTENFSDFPDYLERLADERWNDGTKDRPRPKGIAMFCTGGIRCEKATSYAIQSKLFPEGLPIYQLEGGILAYLDDVAKRKDNEDGGAGNRSEDGDRSTGGSGAKEGSGVRQPQTSTGSTFRGECFVFDKRVAVTEGLRPSSRYVACHGCRGPMDHRLLLPPNEDDENDANVENADDEAVRKYRALADGIANLPSLRFDPAERRHYLPGLTCPRCHADTPRESLERFAQRERQMEICRRQGRSHFEDRGERSIAAAVMPCDR